MFAGSALRLLKLKNKKTRKAFVTFMNPATYVLKSLLC